MSGKRIVEVVELCAHGEAVRHRISKALAPGINTVMCEGGSRRTLTEGQYVLIEDVHDLLPDAWRVLNAAAAFGHPAGSVALWKDIRAALRGEPIPSVSRTLDALSDHTEGTP